MKFSRRRWPSNSFPMRRWADHKAASRVRKSLTAVSIAVLMLASCEQRTGAQVAADAKGEPGSSNPPAPFSGSRPTLGKSKTSEDEKAMRAGMTDANGLLPQEVLDERGVLRKLKAAAEADPRRVLDYYRELEVGGLCDGPRRNIGDA